MAGLQVSAHFAVQLSAAVGHTDIHIVVSVVGTAAQAQYIAVRTVVLMVEPEVVGPRDFALRSKEHAGSVDLHIALLVWMQSSTW